MAHAHTKTKRRISWNLDGSYEQCFPFPTDERPVPFPDFPASAETPGHGRKAFGVRRPYDPAAVAIGYTPAEWTRRLL